MSAPYRGFAVSMPSDQTMSPAAEDVRRHDRERFVTALFAPMEARADLLVLYAFNLEIAKVRESVHEAMAGMIRLQWWREMLSGSRDEEAARHPVAGPLLALTRQRGLSLEPFERMLEARETDLSNEPPADMAALEAYVAGTSAALTELALEILGAEAAEAGRLVGAGYAMTGLLRAVPVHLSTGRLTLPEAVLQAAGTSSEQVLAGRADKAAIAQAARLVGERARELLAQARRLRVERKALPALLPATLASGHLGTLARAGWDVFDSRVARPRPMPVRLAVNAMLGRF
ncbi:MAG: squalene/phytoene synthase family protein [Rhodospirillaceae bacterium]|nr:squalene/phytoene synthase family protein [Rhodospirillales bacterium]